MAGIPGTVAEAVAALCRTLYRQNDLPSTLQVLLASTAQFMPVVRINALYVTRDCACILKMFDTRAEPHIVPYYLNPALKFTSSDGNSRGLKTPIVRPEAVREPLIINDLGSYKRRELLDDPVMAGIPFVEHSSLLRLPLFEARGCVFLMNFWSDRVNAFHTADLVSLQRLTAPLTGELRTDFAAAEEQTSAPSVSTDYYVGQLLSCPGLRPLCSLLRRVAPARSTVSIQGETGVGKEFVARAVHELSGRRDGPFVPVNCGALPEGLVESELFGYERGAFTGALVARKGYFEQARGGTLFLDEIGDLPPAAQVKLLRVLENGSVTRLGASRATALDARIVVATNIRLRDKVRDGSFRRDLWYRLAVFPLAVPPLRERRDDIPVLINNFLFAKARDLNIDPPGVLARDELRRLYAYDWPGNVRELEHVVERSLILHQDCRDKPFRFHLDDGQGGAALAEPEGGNEAFTGLTADVPTLAELEDRYLRAVLRRTGGKLMGSDGAAAVLGIHYSTLRSKMLRLGLPLPRGPRKTPDAIGAPGD